MVQSATQSSCLPDGDLVILFIFVILARRHF
jgi:hypothetical protein